MSRYKAYSEYKDSGVEWLGKTPVDWKVIRLGIFFSERREKVSDKEYIPLSVTKKGIVLQLDSAAKTDNGDNRKKVLIGDFVINSRSDRKGSSGVSSFEGSVSLINIVLMPNNINQKFIHHLFRSERFQEEFYRNGKGIVADLWTTNYSEMKNIYLAVPSSIEQQKIADFLDYETSKIDQLINKQKALIELLKEKRQALISQAVTKGLDPHVKMKDSGIEWLGEVPEHWEIKRLKYVISNALQYGANEVAEYDNPDWPRYIRITDVKEDGSLKEDTFRSLPPDVAQPYILEEGDILLARSGGTVGKSFIYKKIWGKAAYAGYMIKATTDKNNYVDFIYLFFQSKSYWNWLNSIVIQATIQNVSADKYANFWLSLPPLVEQKNIVLEVNKKVNCFNKLIDKALEAIILLQERRTALISAAVIGKIDVRDWQSPNAIDTMTNITPN